MSAVRAPFASSRPETQFGRSARDTKGSTQTGWVRLKCMNDAEIDYGDIPPLDDTWFARA